MSAAGLRRSATTAVVVTYLQLVFGGIVRVTGSGMGCSDHWPKCNGSWIPPFTDPTVMIEWTHRLLALLVLLAVAWLVVAGRQAVAAGIAAAPAVTRAAVAGLVLVISVALLGMITVKLGNTALATVGHWTIAMALLAVLVAAAVRAGSLGGQAVGATSGSSRSARSIGAGAAIAFVVVVLGGLTAKYPGAAVACPSFPLCGDPPAGVSAGAVNIQMAHRILAIMLLLHAMAILVALKRRAGESPVVRTAAAVPLGLLVFQVVFGVMIATSLMPAASLRIAHQATGVAVWLTMFLAAYLATVAARNVGGAGAS